MFRRKYREIYNFFRKDRKKMKPYYKKRGQINNMKITYKSKLLIAPDLCLTCINDKLAEEINKNKC